jgi:glycosyltransferase involved in cell wall biosynthesis
MRILQVIEFFSPKMGGSAQVAYQTARHLTRRGHHVTIWSSDYGQREASFPEGGFAVRLFSCSAASSGLYFTPGLAPYARRHLAQFDIVHMHNVRTFQNIVVGMFARRTGLPYVISPHGSLPRLMERKAAKRAFDLLLGNRLVRDAQRMIAVSAVEVKQFVQAGIPQKKIALVPNGLDLEEFAELPSPGLFRRRLGLTDQVFLILFLGRIHRIKGINHLITAFDQVKHRIDNAHLVIAGPDDGDLGRLRSMAAQLSLEEQIIFTGPVYGQEKLSALVDASVVVLPSQYEIFGLVAFEALMCGTPVIATVESVVGQLLAAHNAGRIIPYGDPAKLAESLIESSITGPEQYLTAGRAYIQNQLDWNHITAALEEIYSGQPVPINQHAVAKG